MKDKQLNAMTYEDFKKRLIKSQETVVFMQKYFEKKKFNVEVPELVIAPESVGAFSEYADNGDMFIEKNGIREKVEIKQSSRTFDLESWPYESVIVNSITGYDSKDPKPDIHIILSKDRKYGYAVRKEVVEEHKYLKQVYDQYKQVPLWFYFVDKQYATFFKIKIKQ